MVTTWDEVAGALPSIKSSAEVLAALQVWKDRSSEYVISVLLRPSSSPATSKILNERRRRLRVLNKKARTAYEFVEKCVESVERAMRIPISHLSQGEQIVVDDEIRKRVALLAHAGKEYLALHDQQETLENLLKDGEAYFARGEMIRYRPPPRECPRGVDFVLHVPEARDRLTCFVFFGITATISPIFGLRTETTSSLIFLPTNFVSSSP